MAICSTPCQVKPPAWASTCKNGARLGGIPYLVFFACDIYQTIANFAADDFSIIADWCTGIEAGDIQISPPLVASKPVASFTKKRTISCAPERPVGAARTISFTSAQVDNTAIGARNVQYTDIDFWNTVLEDQAELLAGYIDCEGRFWGVTNEFSLEVSFMHEDNSQGNAQWEGVFGWQGLYEFKPWLVPGLLDALEGNCPPP